MIITKEKNEEEFVIERDCTGDKNCIIKESKNFKNSGITLIALVVTFIVFLVNIRNVDFAIGCEYL